MTTQTMGAYQDATAANRAGQLTPEQKRNVSAAVKQDAGPLLLLAGLGALIGVMFGAILLFGLVSSGPKTLGEYILFAGLLGFLALLVLPFVVLFALRWIKLQEVRAGVVERANARIAWHGHSYKAQVPGHALDLKDRDLLPGTYAFTFLPRSGRLVAAELVAADPPAQAAAELLRALGAANHFNEADLAAYRAGQLGSAGPRTLLRAWFLLAWQVLWPVVVLVLSVVAFIAFGDLRIGLMLVAVIYLGFLALRGAFSVLKTTLDVLGGQVTSADGVVWGGQHTSNFGQLGGGTSYNYVMGPQKWTVSSDAYQALRIGQTYRVYFLPRSKAMLGLEPIGDLRGPEQAPSEPAAQAVRERVLAALPPLAGVELIHAMSESGGVPTALTAQAAAELLRALAAANHFSDADLVAFRAGRLGAAGARIIRRAWSSTARWLLSAGVVFVLLMANVIARGDRSATIVMGGVIAVLGLVTLSSALRSLRAMREVQDGRVASAEGLVQRVKNTAYYYRLYERSKMWDWAVSAKAYEALIVGPKYRVYFLPGSEALLGLEPIGDLRGP